MLTTRNLSHQYKGSQRFTFPEINCNEADTLLVLGKSGVGKTTLLHILAGILPPTEGTVIVDGVSLYEQKSSAMDAFRGKHIGIIFQKPHFVQSISAVENLSLAQSLIGEKPNKDKINSLLEQLGIAHRASARTHTMSQGEQQRLSIARALINQPKVLLADEPTSALDDDSCNEVISLLEQQAGAAKAALVIVTHDQRLKDVFSNKVNLQ